MEQPENDDENTIEESAILYRNSDGTRTLADLQEALEKLKERKKEK